MDPSPIATEAVRRAVRAALQAEGGGSPVPVFFLDCEPDDFLAAVRRHRVTEVLSSQSMAIGLPERVRATLDDHRRVGATRTLTLVQGMRRVQQVMAEADVRTLFVKGPALAVQTTGDFTARGSGDIDILVPARDLEGAVAALVTSGFVMRAGVPTHVDSWGWRYMKSIYYELALDGPWGTVDLHWRLDPTHGGLPGFTQLWGRRESVMVGPVRVETLSPQDAFLHSCHHAAKDEWRSLRSLVDIHRLSRRGAVAGPSPSRVVPLTLAVVREQLGLTPVPAPTVGPLPIRRALRRAKASQDVVWRRWFPGLGTLRFSQYRLASGRGGADVRRTLAAAVLTPAALAGIAEPGVSSSLRRAIPRRVAYVWRKVTAFRLE